MERKEIERGVTAGPQPEEAELRHLVEEGFTTVIDVRSEKKNGILMRPKEEERVAREVGLTYVHIPVTWKRIDFDQADRLRQAIHDAKGNIYIHSRRGDLAAALTIMDRAVTKGLDPKVAVRQAEAMGVIRAGTRGDDFIAEYVSERVGTTMQD